MELRPNRRNLVVWSSSASRADRDSVRRPTRAQRIRRLARIGALLAILGVTRLAARHHWPLLAGVVLTAVGVALRSGPGGVVLIPGLLLLVLALFSPASPPADRTRRSELERELAAYSTPAQRHDLEATLDRYSDDVTCELREIIAAQPVAAANKFPVAGRY